MIYGLVKMSKDFNSYMLAIFLVNLLLYLAFYIIMKVRLSDNTRCSFWNIFFSLFLLCIIGRSPGFVKFIGYKSTTSWPMSEFRKVYTYVHIYVYIMYASCDS